MATLTAAIEDFGATPFLRSVMSDMFLFEKHAVASVRVESVAYTNALVALAAKLAVVDGGVNKAEYAAYSAIVLPTESFDAMRLRSLFTKHIGDAANALQYARQLASMTMNDAALREALLQKLLRLATCDAALNAAEMELLRAVADIFDISRERFKALVGQFQVPQRSPYEILGVAPETTAAETRVRYLSLVQKLHPDRYQAAGASSDTMAMLSDQLAELNAAYDTIKRNHAKKAAGAVARWWSVRNTKGAKAS